VKVVSTEGPQINVVHVYSPLERIQLPRWGINGIQNVLFVKLAEDRLLEQVISRLGDFLIASFTTISNRDRSVLDVIVRLLGNASPLSIKKWHPEHFICAFCMRPLSGTAYSEIQGKAYCKDCHSNLF